MANTSSSCTVPWVRDDRSVCTNKKDMDKAYWTHYGRITNQQVWLCSNKYVPNICYLRMIVLILVSTWLCLQGGRTMSLQPTTRVWSIFTFNQKLSSMRRVFFTLSYHSLLRLEVLIFYFFLQFQLLFRVARAHAWHLHLPPLWYHQPLHRLQNWRI